MFCGGATPAPRPGGLGAPWTPLRTGNGPGPGRGFVPGPYSCGLGGYLRIGLRLCPLEALRELVTYRKSAGAFAPEALYESVSCRAGAGVFARGGPGGLLFCEVKWQPVPGWGVRGRCRCFIAGWGGPFSVRMVAGCPSRGSAGCLPERRVLALEFRCGAVGGAGWSGSIALVRAGSGRVSAVPGS